ncbi:hypothetical protein PS2_015399 [Malus domestica]
MKHRSILRDTDDFSLQPLDSVAYRKVAVDAKLRRQIFRPVRNHHRFSEGRKESDGFGLPEAEPRQFLVMESAADRTRLSPAATTPCEVDTAAKGLGSGPGRLGLSDQLNELRTDPITALGEANISTVGESLSNSQVSDCNEAFELGANATSAEDFAACAATDASQNVQPSDRLEGSHSQPADDANDSATQSPPTQMMERPGDPASSPYRIPDYVFARNKSTAPLEWSTESNESLFSIQMGNTSFTKDQFNWLCKSGELGLPEVNYLPGSPCNIDFTSNQPPAKQTAQSAENASNKLSTVVEEPSLRVTEEKAAETMREVLRENAVNHEREKSTTAREGGKYHSARLSHASDGSTRSFAFPILLGDINVSLRGEGTRHKHQSGSKRTSQRESQPQMPEETPNASSPPSKPTPIVPKCGWGLSCFSCCPSCCT